MPILVGYRTIYFLILKRPGSILQSQPSNQYVRTTQTTRHMLDPPSKQASKTDTSCCCFLPNITNHIINHLIQSHIISYQMENPSPDNQIILNP